MVGRPCQGHSQSQGHQIIPQHESHSSEPAGLCLCLRPNTNPKCNPSTKGARSPQVSVSATTKAQSQHHESMQPMQPAGVHATPPTTCSCRAHQQQRARSLGQRSLSQLNASSEPRKVSVYACCKKWCHPQKHSPNRMASHQRCHHACHQHQLHYTTRHLHQAAPIDGCFRIGQRRLHGWPEGLIDPPSRNHHRSATSVPYARGHLGLVHHCHRCPLPVSWRSRSVAWGAQLAVT